MRLWPPATTEREGRLVEGVVEPQELRSLKTAADAHARLAAKLATKVAELFYDREETQE